MVAKKKITIGIDPGISGGICAYDGKKMTNVQKCPGSPEEMSDSLREIIKDYGITSKKKSSLKVIIELVHAFPRDSRSSAFKFGKNYGMWLGICASHGLEVTAVTPQIWMKYYGDLPKEKSERKRYLKILATSYFPDLSITLRTADAILIAKYGHEELGRD
jgi:crossover junction endodeoxyribonuclease RuvC